MIEIKQTYYKHLPSKPSSSFFLVELVVMQRLIYEYYVFFQSNLNCIVSCCVHLQHACMNKYYRFREGI